jgi:cytochrome P450
MDTFVYNLIEKRRTQPATTKDFLQVLMDARDEETGEPMSTQQLRDEVFTIFLAGHETTALALLWAFCRLAMHPDVRERVGRELDEVLGGRSPTAEDLPRLRYLGMFVSEVLRLHPPIWVIVRDVVEDDVIGGYYIPAGSVIAIAPIVTQRHPDIWKDPEVFDPERFSPERSQERPRYAHSPFGIGPRTCTGNHFATMEMQVVLAILAQRCHLDLQPGQSLEFGPTPTLRPLETVRMILRHR